MRTTTSNVAASPSVATSTSPRHQAIFTMDRVKAMFSCLASTEAEPAAELCAHYLSGTLSAELFDDQPMASGSSSSSSNNSGSSSPLDGPLASSNNNSNNSSVPASPSGRRAKRSSVKRRKNCKLNHKVDGNRNRAENESEESMHFFPTAGPSSGNEHEEVEEAAGGGSGIKSK